MKSSERCYHVIFNCKVDWIENMSIIAWVAELSGNEGLQKCGARVIITIN
jgi:hypothetical protein